MSSSLTINRKAREKRVAAASGKYSGSLWAWITKIALLGILDAIAAVSYTHLTLPTIYSV